jgi:hypothetical protein
MYEDDEYDNSPSTSDDFYDYGNAGRSSQGDSGGPTSTDR